MSVESSTRVKGSADRYDNSMRGARSRNGVSPATKRPRRFRQGFQGQIGNRATAAWEALGLARAAPPGWCWEARSAVWSPTALAGHQR